MTADEISEACFTAMLGLFFHHSYFVLFFFLRRNSICRTSVTCFLFFVPSVSLRTKREKLIKWLIAYRNLLFVSQEESEQATRFTSENNDIANQRVDTSFFTSKKYPMINQLVSLTRRDYFFLDAFWRVNLGMYIIRNNI